ncbi:hypothetical protein ACEZ3G_10925 [Maribacter algicola]|uniref:Uncharacterized protein n=1 Tax=Meishania litoralis TaxID=3434685 RepID=A0ACC7LL87_9FLAO
MKKIILSLSFVLLLTAIGSAQKKSELIAQINGLEKERDSLKSLVTLAQKNEKVSTARAESFEAQVSELQDANATLLKNLNSFAEVSNKNSNIVNSAMASLEAKEKQLKDIKDAISSNDSTAIVVLTNAKQTLGENANISVSNGAVVISESLNALFGSDTGTAVTEKAETFLGQLAQILSVNPEIALTVEGLSMTGNLDLPAKQAASVASVLQTKFSVDSSRINTLGRDGNLKEGVLLKLHPKYDAFYLMVRESMKNGG